MSIEFAFQTHATLAEWEAAHQRRLSEGEKNYWRMRPEYSQLPQSALDAWDDREVHEAHAWAKQGG